MTANESQLEADDANRLESAIALYRGEFLAGFHVRQAIHFEEWRLTEQERIRQLTIDGTQRLLTYLLASDQIKRGLPHAQRLVEIDTYRERAHQLLMRFLLRDGQRAAALEQFERCRLLLEEELGVEPTVETVQLFDRIRAAPEITQQLLPRQVTSFIGRQRELLMLSTRLGDPTSALVTLLGVGGIGKTRLAIEAASRLRHQFLHGVYFVPLVGIDSADNIWTAIANALGYQFHDADPLPEQLIGYLREKEMLLILDNFEHLLPAGTPHLHSLIQNSPHVKWLVTSRQRLDLPAEWLLPLAGLPHGQQPDSNNDATQLFIERAQQANPTLHLDHASRSAIDAICKGVDGMPLGIELAATWVRTLSCAEIAAELQQSLDILAAQPAGRPQRHRSLQAVFDYSWKLLSSDEQTILKKLAIFQGGFEREAARRVADSSLFQLGALLDKSLVARDEATQRFYLLEIFKQYLREKWSEVEHAAIRDRHADYYAAYLRDGKMMSGQDREMDNVRQAWYNASRHQPVLIPLMLDPLYEIYQSSLWLQEGYDAFKQAADHLQQDSTELTPRLRARQGGMALNLGQFEEARTLLETSSSAVDSRHTPREYAFILTLLSRTHYRLSAYAEAEKLAHESRLLHQSLASESGLAESLRIEGMIARDKGQYEHATELFKESLALYRRLDDEAGLAALLNDLANCYCEVGDFNEALPLYNESLAIYRIAADRFNIAKLLNNIGTVETVLDQYAVANEHLQESADLCRQIGDRAGIAVALMNVGINDIAAGEFESAERSLQECLAIFAEVHYPYMEVIALQKRALVAYKRDKFDELATYGVRAVGNAIEIDALGLAVNSLDNVARLMIHNGELHDALMVVAFVIHNDLSNKEAKDRANDIEQSLRLILEHADSEAIVETGRSATLDQILARIPNIQLPNSNP